MFRHPDVSVCLSFINDVPRNHWYRDILKKTVKDKIVFEIGTGIGLLAAYCLEFGAAHYYGIDIRSSRASITRHVLDKLGYQGKHTILTGDFLSLTSDDIPKNIDILLCEQIGCQFTNNFSIKQFWNHANQIIPTTYQTIPEKWSLDAWIYEGQIDSSLDEYQPTIMLDDPLLPTGFFSAVESTDFVKPSEVIKNVISFSPENTDQEMNFEIDLTDYKSATVVISDHISYQDSSCLSMSYIVDWPRPAKISIPIAGSRFRIQWSSKERDSTGYKKGFWKCIRLR